MNMNHAYTKIIVSNCVVNKTRLIYASSAAVYGNWAYVVGLAFAFGWTPCVGPVLAAVLMVAGADSSVTQGAGLLTVYSAGLGLPFLAAALAMKPFMMLMSRFRRHLRKVEIVIGLLLVATGVLFITEQFSVIAYWLLETFPIFNTVG